MRDYRRKTVVITGAAGGLGSALAQAFGAEGARVVALDLDGARATQLAAALQARGVEALGLACDVSDAPSCRGAIDQAIAHFGGIDVIINNAGISARCLFRDASPEVMDRVMAVNFFGAVHATQAALESLCARHGQIITVSSIAGFSPLVGRTAYAASKHALHGFFDSLRTELRTDGVEVMLVCPSFIATGIERAALGADGRQPAVPRMTTGAEATPAEVARRIVDAARRGRRLCLPARTSRMAWWISRIAPATYERLMLQRVGTECNLASRSRT
jgi:NAD(P)-dependent dehydrogenase (short-subunit alcohol dehydrogenase family)